MKSRLSSRLTSQESNLPHTNINSDQVTPEVDVKNFRPPAEDSTELQRFYNGTNVFITGATGFMGKVLLEKLLRSCPGVETIFLLVREKKGRSLDERIDDLVQSPCFERLLRESPKAVLKLRPIAGDICLEGLGIGDNDRRLLEEKVDIVFHIAATVKFDEKLKVSILHNVRGTRDLVNMSKKFEKLKAFVHVSTVYSHCPIRNIQEQLYESPLDCRKAIALAENLDEEVLEHLMPMLIKTWPNSYVFTKAVAEDVIKVYGEDLPAVVFRPGIVVSTCSEPAPGWIDNLYGPTGAIAGVVSGVVRVMQVDPGSQANIVPCDMAINALLASAWNTAANPRKKGEPPVYNYVCPNENPLSWAKFTHLYIENGKTMPSMNILWYWILILVPGRLGYLFVRFLLHTLPAMLVDVVLVATSRKPKLNKIYNKIHNYIDVIAYFATKQWVFQYGNVELLWERLGEADRQVFPFEMRALNWSKYIVESCPGLRRHLLKQPEDNILEARTKFRRMYWLHRFTQLVLLSIISWIGYLIFRRCFFGHELAVSMTGHVADT